jgi:F420 biosynthesis protein FbiB-like protein
MIRRYSASPVPRTVIDALLDSAIQAPSPHNRQPWRFAVLQGGARIRLASAMAEQLRRDLTRDGVALDAIERDTQRSQARIASAPVAIVACLSLRDMDVYPDARRNTAEHWMAGQAVACAVQNILLTASANELGACWMCAPLFCQETVRETLNLPPDWEAQALVTVGYPADAGRVRERVPARDISIWLDA